MTEPTVTIIGAGLAGSEAALSLADRGIREWRRATHIYQSAHKSADKTTQLLLAEIV